MRISDWSSDVCSSDLRDRRAGQHADDHRGQQAGANVLVRHWRHFLIWIVVMGHGSRLLPFARHGAMSVAACRQVASGSRPYHPKPAPTPTEDSSPLSAPPMVITARSLIARW